MSDEIIDEQLEEEVVTLETTQDYYNHIKLILESVEGDMLKAQKGNKSANARLRKGLRLLKTQTSDYIKFTLKK